MPLYWPRLLGDSGVNRQWLRWLLSLIIFLAFLWCRCPGGQVVCPQWCVVQTSLPSGEPYDCGWSSYRTRQWYSLTGCSRLCICKSLSVFGDNPNFLNLLRLKRRCCAFFTMLAVWVDHFSLSMLCKPRNLMKEKGNCTLLLIVSLIFNKVTYRPHSLRGI